MVLITSGSENVSPSSALTRTSYVASGTKSLNIRVKTKTEAADSWVWNCKKDPEKTIFKNLSEELDYTVIVDLKDDDTPPEYYIIPTVELDRELRAIWDRWFKSPPKRGKPHNPNNTMHRIGASTCQKEWLSQWRGAWSSILSALEAMH